MRKLTPELLDHLPPSDPGAVKSRRDLSRINQFMGNLSWFKKQIFIPPTFISEIGAGDGSLINSLGNTYPQSKCIAYDLAPAPSHLVKNIIWHTGDAFSQPPAHPGGYLLANLFIHHFEDAELRNLRNWFHLFDTLLFNEPLRSPLPQFLGKLAHPFIHPITRHDMRVSIEAGFQMGEIPNLIDPECLFDWKETTTLRGSIRCIATKKVQAA